MTGRTVAIQRFSASSQYLPSFDALLEENVSHGTLKEVVEQFPGWSSAVDITSRS
jgi:hypothetical protein